METNLKQSDESEETNLKKRIGANKSEQTNECVETKSEETNLKQFKANQIRTKLHMQRLKWVSDLKSADPYTQRPSRILRTFRLCLK